MLTELLQELLLILNSPKICKNIKKYAKVCKNIQNF